MVLNPLYWISIMEITNYSQKGAYRTVGRIFHVMLEMIYLNWFLNDRVHLKTLSSAHRRNENYLIPLVQHLINGGII